MATTVYSNETMEEFPTGPLLPWLTMGPFSDIELWNCRIHSCNVSSFNRPRRRPIVRNVQIHQCTVNLDLHGTVIEDVLVDGLATPRTAHAHACVFKHVVLRGRIGAIMITAHIGWGKPKVQRAFDEANAAYYANVDWALDIREAEAKDLDLRDVPAHLVIRDPATQVIITRERALQRRYRTPELAQTHWPGAIDGFLSDNRLPAFVLAAPKRAPDYPQLLAGLQKLREMGVAESD